MEAVVEAGRYVVENLGKALLAFLQRDSYLYWPFLVSSVLIAAIAWHVVLCGERKES